jgi:hypothetical protein
LPAHWKSAFSPLACYASEARDIKAGTSFCAAGKTPFRTRIVGRETWAIRAGLTPLLRPKALIAERK